MALPPNLHKAVPYTTPTTIGRAGNIYIGQGAPNAAGILLVAPKGSLYIQTDAVTTTSRLWIATDSVGGWTFFTTNA